MLAQAGLVLNKHDADKRAARLCSKSRSPNSTAGHGLLLVSGDVSQMGQMAGWLESSCILVSPEQASELGSSVDACHNPIETSALSPLPREITFEPIGARKCGSNYTGHQARACAANVAT